MRPRTTSFALRPLSVTDASEMALVLADPALYRYTGGEPPSVEGLEGQYAVQTRGRSSDGTELWLNRIVVVGPGEQAVGYVQATVPLDGSPAEIAWVIGVPWQGRGYARRAAALLVGELRDHGVEGIVAHIHPDHAASQRVARGLGMAPTGLAVEGEVRWVGATAEVAGASGVVSPVPPGARPR
ncbi:MAG: GNAT family N-acetyltransferase [Kocuria sp.]|uniref:GNAT family N-acetyltransferase n=1 Tax=Kocuria TaxID=57493 RepID=UPI0026DAA255|nr:GNAT family N-acetyltransferase [Kocuria sp.]MDO4255983.1 GNAT family N-acetyltransferase [Kocuria sp.]